MNTALQAAVRDSTGFLNDSVLHTNERVQADALRAGTIQFMCEHVYEYIGFEGDTLHADMPQRPMFQFSSPAESINLISNPTAMVGEVEIMSTSKVLKGSIVVSTTHHDTRFRYGEDVFPDQTYILVQYTPVGDNAGNYEYIVAKSPSYTDVGKLESVPASPPHNKVCLHCPITTKCACTAPSQQSVPAPPPHNKVCLHCPLTTKCACTAPHNKVCLHRPLTTKCACTAPSQQSVPASPPHNKVCLHCPI